MKAWRRPITIALVGVCWAGAFNEHAVIAQQPGADVQRIRYTNTEWGFQDADVATLTRWLGRAGLQLPVTLEGRISGTLSAGVPWGALSDARAWRFGGQFSSPRLLVEGVEFRDVVLRLAYSDGVLRLEEFEVGVPSARAGERPGAVSGAASMALVPRGQLSLRIDVRGIPASTALSTLTTLQPTGGVLTGVIVASVPVVELTQIGSWRASGSLRLDDFVVADLPPAGASLQMELANGQLQARDLRLGIERVAITGEGLLSLSGARRWNASVRLAAEDVAAVLTIVERLAPGKSLQSVMAWLSGGAVDADLRVGGTLAPLGGAANGQATVESLRVSPPEDWQQAVVVKPFTIERAVFNYELTSAAVRLTQFDARLAGGRVTGVAGVNLARGGLEAAAEWSGIRPTAILAEPFGGEGQATGSVRMRISGDAWSDVAAWEVDLDTTLSGLSYQGLRVDDIRSGPVVLRNGRLSAGNIRAAVEGAPAALAVAMDLQAPWAIQASYELSRFDVRALARLPQLAGLGPRIAGMVGTSGEIAGNWRPFVLSGRGRAAGQSLAFDQHVIESIEFDYELGPDVLDVVNLRAALYGGQLTGKAQVTLAANVGGSASVSWAGVDLGAALRHVELDTVRLAGLSAGAVTLTVPPGAIADAVQWSATGRLEAGQLQAYDFDFRQVVAPSVSLAEGKLEARAVSATLDGQPIEAAVSATIAEPVELTIEVNGRGFQAWRLAGLPYLEAARDKLAGRAATQTTLNIAFSPVEVRANGLVAIDEARINDASARDISFRYNLTPESISLAELVATVGGGRIAGSAVVPFSESAPGSAEVNAEDVDIGKVLTELLDPPRPLEGAISGRFAASMPAGLLNSPTAWDVDARVKLDDLRTDNAQVASLEAEIRQQNGELRYTAVGTVLRGVFNVRGQRASGSDADGLAALGDARLTLRGASAAETVRAFAPRDRTAPAVDGTLDVDLIAESTGGGWSWRCDLVSRAIRINGAQLTPGIELRITGAEDALQVERLGGQLAGGDLSGAGRWQFGAIRAPSFRVRLQGAELASLSTLAGGSGELPVEGRATFDLRIRPGDVWRIQATVTAPRAEAYGMTFSNASAPIVIDWNPATGAVRASTTRVNLSLARGRIAGRVTASRTRAWNVDGRLRLSRVDVGVLTGGRGGGSSLASGRMTGTLDLKARNARDVNGLQATLVADLGDAESRGVPLFDRIRTAVPGAQASGGKEFDDGRIEARLSRGVVEVGELSLASKSLQLYITGRMTLAGRLRLEAVAATGQATNPWLAETLLTQLLLAPAAPAALLVRANDFLADRVVHLDIVGTINRPIVRLRAFQTLGEQAVRFFLREASGGVLTGRNIQPRR